MLSTSHAVKRSDRRPWLGKNLKRARLLAGLSQDEVAHILDISGRHISMSVRRLQDFEAGYGNQTIRTLELFERLYRIPLAALLDRDPAETDTGRRRLAAAQVPDKRKRQSVRLDVVARERKRIADLLTKRTTKAKRKNKQSSSMKRS